MKLIIVFGALAIFGGLAYTMWPTVDLSNETVVVDKKVAEGTLANVLSPDTLSQNAKIGKLAFEVKCVSCHGTNAAGQAGVAPPLVHIIYEQNHQVTKASSELLRWVSVRITGHLEICLLSRV